MAALRCWPRAAAPPAHAVPALMPWGAGGQGGPGQWVSPCSPPAHWSSPGQGGTDLASAPVPRCAPRSRDGASDAPWGVWHRGPAPPCPLLAPFGAAGGWAMGTLPGTAPELGSGGPRVSQSSCPPAPSPPPSRPMVPSPAEHSARGCAVLLLVTLGGRWRSRRWSGGVPSGSAVCAPVSNGLCQPLGSSFCIATGTSRIRIYDCNPGWRARSLMNAPQL